VAVLRGDSQEAVAALADCADNAAPFERADFARRLDRLAAEHPEAAPLVAEHRVLLEP